MSALCQKHASGKKTDSPLDQPVCRHRANCVGRSRVEAIDGRLDQTRLMANSHCAMKQPPCRQDRSNEGQLSDLHTQIKEQKRNGDRMMRQTDFGQSARKSQAVQKTKAEG